MKNLRGATKAVLSRISPSTLHWLRRHPAVNPGGEGLPAGDPHHRSYVGPPADYDLIAGLTFSLLINLGLRSGHTVCDLGCGSLRVGRLLIPYLDRGNYFGVEPNRWLIQRGINWEIGRSQKRLKKPQFSYKDDFDISTFDTSFDFVIAQSIFSHTFPDLLAIALRRVSTTLEGSLVGTFLPSDRLGHDDRRFDTGSGWLYPGCVVYDTQVFQAALEEAGLVVEWLDWQHPRQTWFRAKRS